MTTGAVSADQSAREQALADAVVKSFDETRDLGGKTWSEIRFDIVLAPARR